MNFLPNAELFFLSRKKLVRKSTTSLFEGKDVLLIGLNAAFSPTDTEMVKEYEAAYDTFIKDTEVDEIYFVSMNDPYVMDAWWKSMKIKKCKYLPDGNGALTLRIDNQGGMSGGMTVVEMYNRGMGKRTWRFALLLEDNCQMTYIEEETPAGYENGRNNCDIVPYDLTHPDQILEHLKKRNQIDRINAENSASLDLSMPR
jgi:peroxiredoxin|tara:strand:+ start:718 stop:1317 length:600 start_codon:yes stop_codon:yes gene_type:complete